MRILAIEALRPGSDHDAYVWRTTWLRRRFQEGHIAKAGEHLLGDNGYPPEPWLLTPVPGHPPAHTAEVRYNTAHASMRSVVERCIGLLKSRFRCLQRYRALMNQTAQPTSLQRVQCCTICVLMKVTVRLMRLMMMTAATAAVTMQTVAPSHL
ncbi:hypothetical protein HPB49_024010 [Dermacentor silvarum]|uniref:Uncharacterized protein n=1 Tax=Dermacentor silvarum TaxID=543639 RepID=A0ACB8D907_DERSI|nr:hypothetical protein HPB49_024010 [Dermacentor silvarum]